MVLVLVGVLYYGLAWAMSGFSEGACHETISTGGMCAGRDAAPYTWLCFVFFVVRSCGIVGLTAFYVLCMCVCACVCVCVFFLCVCGGGGVVIGGLCD
jgi:hypothetical protein